jgi:predicted nuclease of restriction endonuclease-like RecB superfamily
VLPSDLLAVWKRKGLIWPRYAKLSDENFEVAAALIEAYRRRVGEKKGALREFVVELEDKGFEYRFVRGLSFLLDKRSVFRCDSKINPVDLRRSIYQKSTKSGLPTRPRQRAGIVAAVASELGVTLEQVEVLFYADLETELVLDKFDPLSPRELLEMYNLSLTQTLLFDCVELSFSASANWQNLFYAVKRLGLIYEVTRNGRFWVKIDGPSSLFKLTRRYGTAFARLLPVIVASPEWTVEAKILWKYTNELCTFKAESWKHRALLKPQLAPVSYDSAVEEDFALRFEALKSGWRLKREPEPVVAGKQVIIPDFSLEREGVRVYLEIVGFWTPEYLLRKMEKLKKVSVPMLVAVDEDLACEKLARMEKHTHLDVIYYRGRIPLKPVLRYLGEAFQGVHAGQAGFVKDLSVVFTEPAVSFEEFAMRIGVSVEAVKTALTEKPPPGYVVLSSGLVREDKLEQIRGEVEAQMGPIGRLSLSEAVRIVEAEGVADATRVFEVLGYKVLWRGINAEKAEVVRR